MITEYWVVKSDTLENLIEKVNNHLELGWKLQGGIGADNYRGWFQALIHEHKVK